MGRQRLRARRTGPREAGARRAQERGQAGAGLGGPRGALPAYLLGAAPGWPASPFPSSARRALQLPATRSPRRFPPEQDVADCTAARVPAAGGRRRRRLSPREQTPPPRAPGPGPRPAAWGRLLQCLARGAGTQRLRQPRAAWAPGPRPPARGTRAPMSPDAAVPGARCLRRPRLGGGVAALSRERCVPSQDPVRSLLTHLRPSPFPETSPRVGSRLPSCVHGTCCSGFHLFLRFSTIPFWSIPQTFFKLHENRQPTLSETLVQKKKS